MMCSLFKRFLKALAEVSWNQYTPTKDLKPITMTYNSEMGRKITKRSEKSEKEEELRAIQMISWLSVWQWVRRAFLKRRKRNCSDGGIYFRSFLSLLLPITSEGEDESLAESTPYQPWQNVINSTPTQMSFSLLCFEPSGTTRQKQIDSCPWIKENLIPSWLME